MDLADFELLLFGSPVSDTDKARISAALAEAVLELDRLDAQIKELTRKRSALETSVENFRAILAPIRKLPRDALEEIFCWCIPSTRNAIMSAREAPLSLGRVCSYWRRVSRSTPKLWSTLHLALPTYPYTNRIDPAMRSRLIALRDATDSWLNRSGTVPLSISIYGTVVGYGINTDERSMIHNLTQDIVSTLLSFSRRWKKVRLDIPDVFLYPFNKYSSDDFPILSHIRSDPGHLTNDHQDLLACVMKAPAIQSISLPLGFRVLDSVKSIAIPLEQLTSLSIKLSWDSPVSPLDFLSLTSSLEKLYLRLGSEPSSWPPNPVTNTLQGGVVVLSRLRHFSFLEGAHEASICPHFFSFLCFPSLQSLSYTCLGRDINTFPPMILPAGVEPLLSLRITIGDRMDGVAAPLIDYLRSSLQIRVLELSEGPESLPMDQTSFLPQLFLVCLDPLCPKLEVLRLEGWFIQTEPLEKFVRSRMAPHSPLRRVDLTFRNVLSEDDADRMQRLRVECQSKGIKMTFRARREYKHITRARDGARDYPRRNVQLLNIRPRNYDEDEDEGFQ